MADKKINVNGLIIRTSKINQDHYISLTDLAKARKAKPATTIANWVRNLNTINFLGLWEKLNNTNFKVLESEHFKGFKAIQDEYVNLGNLFVLSPAKWIQYTNGIGFKVIRGKYGGTWAHEDIALEFASWLSSEFRLYVITEFKRLKAAEQMRLGDPFNIKRSLTTGNYSLLVTSILSQIDERLLTHPQPYKSRLPFAAEADMINKIVFGNTSKEWRLHNADKPTNRNQRDFASVLDLTVLNNLEFLDAMLIQWDVVELEERRKILQTTYDFIYPILKRSKTIKELQELADRKLE